MKIAHIYIEHSSLTFDQTFAYQILDETIMVGMRVYVEFRRKKCIGIVYQIEELSCEDVDQLPYQIKPILEKYDDEAILNEEMFALAEYMAKSYVSSKMKCFQCMLPSKLKPKSSNLKIKKEVWVTYVCEKELQTKKQVEVLEQMKERKSMKRSDFLKEFKSIGKKLLDFGCLKLEEKECEAEVETLAIRECEYELSLEQKIAISEIEKATHRKESTVFLLHGVTGAGKSEVFFQATAKVLQQGKQVLILVPEISLTTQMIQLLKDRFSNHLAIYHSRLNAQEMYEQYRLVKQQKVQLVVGTRSAIFMPLEHLGLIVMDEEHDLSYKQDQNPRYHCRDLVIKRGEWHQCPIVLASATPSIDSYARAYKHQYKKLVLSKRIVGRYPKIELINMRESMQKGEGDILNKKVVQKIQHCLSLKKQVILFLNRRGYTPVLRCLNCNEVLMCPNCDVPLNYHKDLHMQKCHLCNYQIPFSSTCPSCKGQHWQSIGYGTQKIEEYVKTTFPNANVLRMDADTTKKKDGHKTLIEQFENQEYDILIGTQMIAKGLDFKNVALVVVVNGDASLYRSDYRSGETTYNLLTQVCGRSARHQEGEVCIQVFDPNPYILQCVLHHAYDKYFAFEMHYRHMCQYPPYSFLASIVLYSNEEGLVSKESQIFEKAFDKTMFQVLGPSILGKRNQQYRIRFLIKSKKKDQLLCEVWRLFQVYCSFKLKSRIDIDMNPVFLE